MKKQVKKAAPKAAKKSIKKTEKSLHIQYEKETGFKSGCNYGYIEWLEKQLIK